LPIEWLAPGGCKNARSQIAKKSKKCQKITEQIDGLNICSLYGQFPTKMQKVINGTVATHPQKPTLFLWLTECREKEKSPKNKEIQDSRREKQSNPYYLRHTL
jgi:hypothetical protein